MTRATWINGKRRITGSWYYNWSADVFVIQLDSIERITGLPRAITIHGDSPEWGNWRRSKEQTSCA